jgi:NADH:ubiquinone oxidoreductase subunit 2 (subunit N)
MPDGFRGILETHLRQFALLSPEVMLVFTFLAALIFDLAVTQERKRSTGYICILGTLVALWLSVIQNTEFLKTLASLPSAQLLPSL